MKDVLKIAVVAVLAVIVLKLVASKVSVLAPVANLV